MKSAILSLAMLAALGAASQQDHWAVLVAGSRGFYNYRHQSDICHAYKMLTQKGYSADHIITLSYNDVASSSQNPFPNTLYNKPNGEDVYKGCVMDYQGSEVTPQNFLNVLEGNSNAVNGKKVLRSGSNDRVFIYFADHGAPGLIAFPNGELYAKDFIATLKKLYQNKSYKEMVIYIEACESGSMFDGLLPSSWNIYATTAANTHESSWGYYCYPDDQVNGKHIGSCLGDLYSIKFLENADSANLNSESLQKQYSIIKKETTKSHVMQYGDKSFVSEPAGNFQGISNSAVTAKDSIFDKLKDKFTSETESRASVPVSSRDVKLHYYYSQHLEKGDHLSALALQRELTHRQKVDHIFEQFKTINNLQLHKKYLPRDWDCYKNIIQTYKNYCGEFKEYELKYANYFAHACEAGHPFAALKASLEHICQA